jgi:hypothetical protein
VTSGGYASWRQSLTVLLALQIMSSMALAQEPQRGETVMTRQRQDFDAIGIRVGGFAVFPVLAYTGVYDTNIFATENDTESDFISTVSPNVAIRSNWNNHALNLSASADIGRYATFGSQDFNDWQVSGDGRLDITRDAQLFAGGGYSHLHEPRTSPNAADGLKPTLYTETSAFGRYEQSFGRPNLTAQGDFAKLAFDNATAPNGQIIVEDDRDRNDFDVGLRGGYQITPRHQAFLRGRGIFRNYDSLQSSTNFDRSSQGYEIVAGVQLDLGGVTFGDVFVGYRDQIYKDPLPNISVPTFGLALDWNASTLTTVNVSVERDIGETTDEFFSGFISTTGGIIIDHELKRNFLLSSNFTVTNNEYVGIESAEKNDYIYTAGFKIKYMLNRYFYGSIGYEYQKRNSSDNINTDDFSDNNYKIHTLFFRLEAQR